MAICHKFQCFVGDLGLQKHNLNGDTLNIYLSNTAPSASAHTVFSNVSEIAAVSGYTAGGADIQNAYAQTDGVGAMTGTDVMWTAGASMGPFRYAVLYNSSATEDNLIGWWDYGAEVTLNTGETFTVDFGASVLTIA